MKPQSNEQLVPDMDSMRLGIEYRAKIHLKGKSFRVRPLSTQELLQSNEEVVEYFGDKAPELRLGINEALVIAMIRLEKASTSSPSIFDPELPESFLKTLTSDEVHYLWKQYTSICERVNPEFDEMSHEELHNLVESVKKSPDRATLTVLSFYHLVDVCLHFAKESQKSPQDR